MKLFSKKFKIAMLLLLSLLIVQCQNYYQRNINYHVKLQNSNFKEAENVLDNFKLLKKKRNTLLLQLEKGKLAHLQNEFELSNHYFNKADILIEDFNRTIKDNALELTLNAQVQLYKPEDFEKIFIHYYKALNYIYLNDLEGALVEAKRINLKLQSINDKYKNDKNKYAQDAFAHILMGMIYEANNDVNNAFIAYRNAVDLYLKNEENYMNVSIPLQLKKDIIYTAYQNGFTSEQKLYEDKFGIELNTIYKPKRELILFWENGLSPVKTEWSINFTVVNKQNGVISFVNNDLNLNFTFNNYSNSSNTPDLRLIRVAYPKYMERTSRYNNAIVQVNNQNYIPEVVEDISYIARETLQDRFFREMSASLLRLFVKQSTELAIRNENQELGALVGVFNAVTEKADTRQWQTLPKQISYVRIPIDNLETVKLELVDKNGFKTTREITIPKSDKKIVFANIHTLESVNDF